MALTHQSVLRVWMLDVLIDEPRASARRARVLEEMERRYRGRLTATDWEAPANEPKKINWRVRASFERHKMVKEGLLKPRNDGIWELTEIGVKTAQRSRRR